MELKDMTIDELMERRSAIATEVDSEGADLDALENEVRGINAELESRKDAEEKKAEIRSAVAEGKGEVRESIPTEERKKMDINEIRNSAEYINAFANYVKTDDDTEVRALLTENVSGGVIPVPEFVGEIISERFKESKILNRVRKSYARGNFKQPFEYDAPIATAHTEGGEAVEEEALALGFVELKATTWKKWVSISDEALDLMSGEAFLRYIYDEVARGIVKAREKAVIDAILNAPQTATASAPSVAKTGTAKGNLTDIINAKALLGDGAEDIVAIVSKSDYAMYRGLQMGSNYGVDPFDGLEVIESNYATTPIVGDLFGVMENFSKGDDSVQMKFDDLSKKKEDIVEILGRLPSAIAVVGDKFFAKVSA